MPEPLNAPVPIAVTVLILGVLIFVHELGHFLACRLRGVGVEKFSIGFGPELAAWQGRQTRYSISWIPFGGFVKPQGETQEAIRERLAPDPRDYLTAPIATRFLILIAGVAMNYLLAYVLFVAVLWIGRPVLSATIGGFVTGYPAETSGLKVGDQVTGVNARKVRDWQDVTLGIMESKTEILRFSVLRAGRPHEVEVEPRREEGQDVFGRPRRIPRIGILPADQYREERSGFWGAWVQAAQLEWRLTRLTYEAIWYLVTGQLSLRAVSGPIGIVALAGSAAKTGVLAILQLTAVLSVSLAVVNLLPIPALDGGHLCFLVVEAISRKRVSIVVQERLTQLGFYMLMILMVLVVYNDLVHMGAVDKLRSVFSSSAFGPQMVPW